MGAGCLSGRPEGAGAEPAARRAETNLGTFRSGARTGPRTDGSHRSRHSCDPVQNLTAVRLRNRSRFAGAGNRGICFALEVSSGSARTRMVRAPVAVPNSPIDLAPAPRGNSAGVAGELSALPFGLATGGQGTSRGRPRRGRNRARPVGRNGTGGRRLGAGSAGVAGEGLHAAMAGSA